MKKIILAEQLENEELRKEFIYKKDWRYSMLSDTYIHVYAPYKILKHEGERYIVSAACEEDLKEGYRGHMDTNMLLHSHSITPFQYENLLFEALKIDLEKEKSILKFCNQYGVLGEERQKNTFDELELTGVNERGWFETLNFFKKEIEELHECFSLYMITETDNETEMRNRWKEFNEKQLQKTEQEITDYHKNPQKYEFQYEDDEFHVEGFHLQLLNDYKKMYQNRIHEKAPKKDIIMGCKGLLIGTINKKLPNIFLNIQMTHDGQLIEGITSFTLIGTLYYQLYQHIVKGNQFKICKYCGNYFVPRKSDSNFCPAEKANEHSKCANAYNAMVRRARKWHYGQGIPLEEIQKKIKRPMKRSLAEIQYWINNYKKK